ncbi:hypothetical protein F5B21DRAFT_504973 [Xylaria acuta]|nr:hypothetical protein F5B21DRAFT_504973 [Xylaria acuta]
MVREPKPLPGRLHVRVAGAILQVLLSSELLQLLQPGKLDRKLASFHLSYQNILWNQDYVYSSFGTEAVQSADQLRDHMVAVLDLDRVPRSGAVFEGRCDLDALCDEPLYLRDIVFVADPSVYADPVDGQGSLLLEAHAKVAALQSNAGAAVPGVDSVSEGGKEAWKFSGNVPLKLIRRCPLPNQSNIRQGWRPLLKLQGPTGNVGWLDGKQVVTGMEEQRLARAIDIVEDDRALQASQLRDDRRSDSYSRSEFNSEVQSSDLFPIWLALSRKS